MEKKDNQYAELARLRKKVNKSALHRNICLMFSVLFFIMWFFELSPCMIGNIWVYGFLFSLNLFIIAHQFVIRFQFKVYEERFKQR